MKEITFKIKGITPLMLNNPQVVNPFNDFAKKIKKLTSKKTKTEEDHLEISRLQFLASLYVKDGKYIIPAEHFEQSIIAAAKERKLGATFERSFQILNDCTLEFKDKDKAPEELYKLGDYTDVRVVGVMKKNKIIATRAIFPVWETELTCYYDETQLNKEDIISIFETAGFRYGVGTYRRRYGRFEVGIVK